MYKKSFHLALLLLTLIIEPALAQAPDSFNAEAVVGDLGRIAKEVDAITAKVTDQIDLQNQSTGLRSQVSALAASALSLKVRSTQANLTKLGFDISTAGSYARQYSLVSNNQTEVRKSEARHLDNQHWAEIKSLANQQVTNLQALAKNVSRQDLIVALNIADKRKLQDMGDQTYSIVLSRIIEQAEMVVDCVDEFKLADQESGLRVVIDNNGNPFWDVERLTAKYGVGDLESLSKSDSAKVNAKLQNLKEALLKDNLECGPISLGQFIETEIKVTSK